MKEQKPKKCAICREPFLKRSMSHKTCKMECAIALVNLNKAKAERKQTKQKLLDLEPLSCFLRNAERACNAYIRARDAGQGCISCGRHNAEVWNAGHFISVGANSSLRYDEDNIHLQCARPCNKDKGGNIVEYRKNLLKKIGVARVERLEGWHPPVKRTRADAEAIERHYKQKLATLKQQDNNSPRLPHDAESPPVSFDASQYAD